MAATPSLKAACLAWERVKSSRVSASCTIPSNEAVSNPFENENVPTGNVESVNCKRCIMVDNGMACEILVDRIRLVSAT